MCVHENEEMCGLGGNKHTEDKGVACRDPT